MRFKTDAEYVEWQRKRDERLARTTVAPLVPKAPPAALPPPPAPAKKAPKYRNRKIELDGHRFDSEHEAKVWLELRAREERGEICELVRQVRFELKVDGTVPIFYVADFCFRSVIDGKPSPLRQVVDAKSAYTRKLPLYRAKRALMKVCHGVEIAEF